MTATRDVVPALEAPVAPAAVREQSRARYPHATGFVERAGGRVAYEVYGAGDPPIVFVPPWQVVHSRVWKAQIPVFARRHLVVAWDNRGNGRSDRPTDPAAHTTLERTANLEAVMNATGVDAAVLVGLSSSSGPLTVFAAKHPGRVLGLVYICPAWSSGEHGPMAEAEFEEPLQSDEGWARLNRHYWRRDYRGFLEFFFSEAVAEAHSTKQVEDAVGYGLDTDPESLAATHRAPRSVQPEEFRAMAAAIEAPTLVIQGTDERISHVTQGIELAGAIPGARLELVEGSGHFVNARQPIRVNLLIRDFVRSLPGTTG